MNVIVDSKYCLRYNKINDENKQILIIGAFACIGVSCNRLRPKRPENAGAAAP